MPQRDIRLPATPVPEREIRLPGERERAIPLQEIPLPTPRLRAPDIRAPEVTPEEREQIRRDWDNLSDEYWRLVGGSASGSGRMSKADLERGYKRIRA